MLYATWLILMVFGLGAMIPSLLRFYTDWKQVGVLDAVLLTFSALFLFIVAASAGGLSFETSSGLQTNNADWYLGFIFYPVALIDLLLVIVSVIIPIRALIQTRRRGYNAEL